MDHAGGLPASSLPTPQRSSPGSRSDPVEHARVLRARAEPGRRERRGRFREQASHSPLSPSGQGMHRAASAVPSLRGMSAERTRRSPAPRMRRAPVIRGFWDWSSPPKWGVNNASRQQKQYIAQHARKSAFTAISASAIDSMTESLRGSQFPSRNSAHCAVFLTAFSCRWKSARNMRDLSDDLRSLRPDPPHPRLLGTTPCRPKRSVKNVLMALAL